MREKLLTLGLILTIVAFGNEASAAGLQPQVCTAYAPVLSNFSFGTSTNGPTSVYTYSPNIPTGLIVALHGGGGSAANMAEYSVESKSFFNDAAARGYAILVPESNNRSTKQWSTVDTFPSNPDAVRIANLIEIMGNDNRLLRGKPVFFVGFSQGGGAAPIIAALLKAKAVPVKAISVYCSGNSGVYRNSRYDIPVTFNLMAADSLIDASAVQLNVTKLNQRSPKVDAQMFVKPVERVCPLRFARIEQIEQSDSTEIYNSLVAGGTLTTEGVVTVPVSDTVSIDEDLPSIYLRYNGRITDQLGVVSAQHAFYGDQNRATLDFFDNH